MTTPEIADQLAGLSPEIRGALVGHGNEVAEAVGSLTRRVQLGYEMISLTGLLLLARKEIQTQSPFNDYIREILFGGRHYLPGYAIAIVNDALEILEDAGLASALKAFHQTSNAWLDVMKGLNGREKNRILWGARSSVPLREMTACFFRLVPRLLPHGPIDIERYEDSLLPFFFVRRTEGVVHPLLYSLRHVSTEEGKACFWNLPKHDELEIDLGLDTGSVETKLKKSLARFKQHDGLRQAQDEDMRVAPLLAATQPQILLLSNHLLKNTELETLEKLWLPKMPASYRKEHSTLHQSERERWFKEQRHIIRDSIILDCIENDPVVVLLKVAQEEGESELSEYLIQLLGQEAKDQIDRAKETSGWCGEKSTPMEQRQFVFYQRLLAVAVARALGFAVSAEHRLKGASWFREEATAKLKMIQQAEWGSIRSDECMLKLEGVLTNVVRDVYEPIMKEFCIFYSYLNMSLDRSGREFKFLDYTVPSWRDKVSHIQRSTPGALLSIGRNFLGDKVLSQCLLDQWGLSLGNASERLAEVTRDDAPDNMIAILNTFKHNKEYSDTELSRALRRKDRDGVDVVKKYVIAFLQDLVNLLDLLIDGTSGHERRLFPYKLTFAVRAETAYGIKRCSYYTDACDEESTRETEIYCDEGVDLRKVYLCLPDRRRRSRRVWVNPLLIDAEILGAGTRR